MLHNQKNSRLWVLFAMTTPELTWQPSCQWTPEKKEGP
jgi:hypothetical protein